MYSLNEFSYNRNARIFPVRNQLWRAHKHCPLIKSYLTYFGQGMSIIIGKPTATSDILINVDFMILLSNS